MGLNAGLLRNDIILNATSVNCKKQQTVLSCPEASRVDEAVLLGNSFASRVYE